MLDGPIVNVLAWHAGPSTVTSTAASALSMNTCPSWLVIVAVFETSVMTALRRRVRPDRAVVGEGLRGRAA